MLIQSKQVQPNLQQLKNFQRWQAVNGDGFSLLDYLAQTSRMETAIAFTKLFWPDFVQHEQGIFLKEQFSLERYIQWQKELQGDITAIEKVMNHLHLDDLLPGSEKVGQENLLYLAETLQQMWESRLKILYPQQDFDWILNHDDATVVMTFHQSK